MDDYNTKDKTLQDKAYDLLFDIGQNVCFQHKIHSKPCMRLYEPFKEEEFDAAMQYIVLNPFLKGSTNRLEKEISLIQSLTIEMDSGTREQQKKIIEDIFGTPTVQVWSGNKSIHNHYRFNRPISRVDHQNICDLVIKAFPLVDDSVLRETHKLVRNPGANRYDGSLQEIISVCERIDYEQMAKRLEEHIKLLRPSVMRVYQRIKYEDIAHFDLYASEQECLDGVDKIVSLNKEDGMVEKHRHLNPLKDYVHKAMEDGYLNNRSNEQNHLYAVMANNPIVANLLHDILNFEYNTTGKFMSEEFIDSSFKGTKKNCQDNKEIQQAVIETLLECPNVFDHFQDFKRIMLALKSIGLEYDGVVDQIFQRSSGYNAQQNKKMYNLSKPNQINFGTAYWYAQYANPEMLKSKLSSIASERCKKNKPTVQAEQNVQDGQSAQTGQNYQENQTGQIPQGEQFENFTVNDQGIFMRKINRDKSIEQELIYNKPIRLKNSIEIIDSYDQDEPLRITLELENNTEKIIKASDLCKKNIDKLCDKGIFLFDSNKAAKLCEYFNIAAQKIPRKKMYKVLGWHGQEFIISGLVDNSLILEKSNYLVKEGHLEQAVQVVQHLVEVTRNKTFLPLFLFSLLASASDKLGINAYRFALFCQGQTGNFKTTLSRYSLAIYGEEMFNDFVRFNEGATINGLITKCSLAGDLPILIDNFKPNLKGGESGLIHIISTLVEGRDKIRCNTKGEIKNPVILKSWPIITGETGIESDTSSIARCLELEFEKTYEAIEHLSFAEKNKGTLCYIGYHWINFLKNCNTQQVKELWPAINKKWELRCNQQEIVNSCRVASNCSCLELVLHLAKNCDGLSFLSNYEEDLEQILSGLLKNMGKTTSEAREGFRFLTILRQLLETGRVSLMKKGIISDDKKETLMGIESKVPAIGWIEESEKNPILYLYPEVAIEQVRKVVDLQITRNALLKQLDELGIIIKTEKSKTKVKKIAGKSMRVFALDYQKFKEEIYEQQEKDIIEPQEVQEDFVFDDLKS
ncbi:MAG: DUF927 domain-containing protein [Candidatus Brocadiae bacterium]|nr:DUF927 domain-containing protein [Candidatus Brocadiia bacterium]